MPHKQKRKRGENSEAVYDLPPTHKAKPLSGSRNSKQTAAKTSFPIAHQNPYKADDTPKAFARLLNFQKTGKGLPKGLDNGKTPRAKKRKIEEAEKVVETIEETQKVGVEQDLRIQPGEKLSEFSVRVNQALPISGLSTKGKKIAEVKERRTKHEKRLRKLQEGWRKDEARIREKEEEEREQAEEEWEEKLAGMDKDTREVMVAIENNGGKSKKKKQGKAIGEIDEDEGDPWAVLKQKRDAPKGVFDVVQAPPKFDKVPREIFKQAKTTNVPKDAGSLRRREELGATRADIISSYRSIMAGKRGS